MCCAKDWILGKNKENNKATTTITHCEGMNICVYTRANGEPSLCTRRIVYAYISCNYIHTKLHSHIRDSSASHSAAQERFVCELAACSSAALPSFRALRVSPLDVRETRSCVVQHCCCYILMLAEEVIAPLQQRRASSSTRCVLTYSNSEKGWRGARTLRSPADARARASSRGGGGGGGGGGRGLEKVFYDVNLKFQYNPRAAAATAGASRLSLSLALRALLILPPRIMASPLPPGPGYIRHYIMRSHSTSSSTPFSSISVVSAVSATAITTIVSVIAHPPHNGSQLSFSFLLFFFCCRYCCSVAQELYTSAHVSLHTHTQIYVRRVQIVRACRALDVVLSCIIYCAPVRHRRRGPPRLQSPEPASCYPHQQQQVYGLPVCSYTGQSPSPSKLDNCDDYTRELYKYIRAERADGSSSSSELVKLCYIVTRGLLQPTLSFALPPPCLAPYICQGTQNWCTRETLLQYKYTQRHTHIQISLYTRVRVERELQVVGASKREYARVCAPMPAARVQSSARIGRAAASGRLLYCLDAATRTVILYILESALDESIIRQCTESENEPESRAHVLPLQGDEVYIVDPVCVFICVRDDEEILKRYFISSRAPCSLAWFGADVVSGSSLQRVYPHNRNARGCERARARRAYGAQVNYRMHLVLIIIVIIDACMECIAANRRTEREKKRIRSSAAAAAAALLTAELYGGKKR
ncbi:unnamed protein product [Trichogramma brassicae]|uniref:Uncharacterized protein n=1 Tax=Trichogramma brassicae TaxID=86971 RepID=A0A6H5HYJ3_9HYME|nr:unnamed protein product [Trichogramma brassicae]